MNGWFVVYFIVLLIAILVMTFNGMGINTWQYWVIWVCIILARISGTCGTD